MRKNWTDWFEIPVNDFNRAKKFYETIFQIEINVLDFGNLKMGVFPGNDTTCAICCHEEYRPSADGLLVYFDANPDLNIILSRVQNADGKTIRHKTQISPDKGFMALILDSEGNRIGLYSQK